MATMNVLPKEQQQSAHSLTQSLKNKDFYNSLTNSRILLGAVSATPNTKRKL